MRQKIRNICFGLSVFVVFIIVSYVLNVQNSFEVFINFKARIQGNRKKAIPACNVPVLNPFHKDALNVWKTPAKEECNTKKLSKIHEDSLIVDDVDGDIKSVHVEYIIRGRRKKADGTLNHPTMKEREIILHKRYSYNRVLNDDFHIYFSKPIPVKRNSEKKQFILNSLKEDFSCVTIMKRDNTTIKEYHYHISNKQKVCDCGEHGTKKQYAYNAKVHSQKTTKQPPTDCHN